MYRRLLLSSPSPKISHLHINNTNDVRHLNKPKFTVSFRMMNKMKFIYRPEPEHYIDIRVLGC